jgi:hypothetical protein
VAFMELICTETAAVNGTRNANGLTLVTSTALVSSGTLSLQLDNWRDDLIAPHAIRAGNVWLDRTTHPNDNTPSVRFRDRAYPLIATAQRVGLALARSVVNDETWINSSMSPDLFNQGLSSLRLQSTSPADLRIESETYLGVEGPELVLSGMVAALNVIHEAGRETVNKIVLPNGSRIAL